MTGARSLVRARDSGGSTPIGRTTGGGSTRATPLMGLAFTALTGAAFGAGFAPFLATTLAAPFAGLALASAALLFLAAGFAAFTAFAGLERDDALARLGLLALPGRADDLRDAAICHSFLIPGPKQRAYSANSSRRTTSVTR